MISIQFLRLLTRTMNNIYYNKALFERDRNEIEQINCNIIIFLNILFREFLENNRSFYKNLDKIFF